MVLSLFQRFTEKKWSEVTLFGKIRMIWFGPPTLICWLSSPVFFVIALITWSAKFAEYGGMAVLLGYVGLFLSGIKTIKEAGKFFVSEDLHGSKLGAIGGGLSSMILEIVAHFVMYFLWDKKDKTRREVNKFSKKWKENMKKQQELNRERDE